MRRGYQVVLAAVLLALPVIPAVGEVDSPPTSLEWGEKDYRAPDPSALDGLAVQADDPLGLLPGIDFLRSHSLGPDVIDVWACDLGVSAATVVQQLDNEVVPYFHAHSQGRYQPDFVARGESSGGPGQCLDDARNGASSNANGALIALPFGGGLGGPGDNSPNFPLNDRWALVNYPDYFTMIAVHELGHTLTWPHSYTGNGYDEYDNAMDVLSGNFAMDGSTHPEPYDTAVINRYAAGWIDTDQVRVLGGTEATFTLRPSPGSGLQMAVIPDGGRYYTLGARTRSTYDPIPEAWQGVEVYEVTPCPETDPYYCFFDPEYQMGFRRSKPLGGVPYEPESTPAHLIRPGSSKTVAGRTVSVASASGGAYAVTVGPGEVISFTDTSGHVFADDIEWLAAEGITRGCNPPSNSQFCPNDVVTRGQMAAFLHRALPDLPLGAAVEFNDDNSSVFEADIEWLAATGVTRGCNPPANDQFCPGDVVTRGQMAAFLHRALPDLTATGPTTDFGDDNSSVFEADIEWLAATGVTRGCNPPANDRFCPTDPVTRGAMAAFLHRALGG